MNIYIQEANNLEPYLDLSEISPNKIFTKSGNKTYQLNVATQGDVIVTNLTKDRHKGTYSTNIIKIPDGHICLWYKWRAGRNQYQKDNIGWRFKHLILPQKIPLNKQTLNTLGVLQAEMTKYSKRACSIIFTNGEPNLNKIVMKFFKRFGVCFRAWSWNIIFNFKLKERETKDGTRVREWPSEKFWLNRVQISSKRRQNVFMTYTGNKHYKNMRESTNRLGNLRILYSNIILYQLSLELLEKIKRILPQLPAEFTKYYLQGLMAGEGDVKLTKTRSVDSIRIGCMNDKEKKFYSECLSRLGIVSRVEKNGVTINNQRNFVKVYKHQLLSLHQKRQEKFLEGMKQFKRIPAEVKTVLNEIKNI
jgi:hypothetical protein